MNDNPPLLLLRLEAPLQSWGLRGRWDVRDTGKEPSKSGIVGLLGCALGYKKGDPRLEAELDAKLVLGIREEREGTESLDFQTINGDHFVADGGIKKDYTVVSPRAYLHDASFLVAIGGPAELLSRCKAALESPRWPIYLGRKSCVPTRPVLDCMTTAYKDIRDALTRHPWQAREGEPPAMKERPRRLRCVVESLAGTKMRPDAMRVNPARMYAERAVEEDVVDCPPSIVKESSSKGDP